MKLCTWMRIAAASLLFLLVNPALAQEQASQDSQTVNINTATVEQLAEGLAGIGMAKAAEIVSHRETFGAFIAVEELMEVKGIGESLLLRNKERIVLGSD